MLFFRPTWRLFRIVARPLFRFRVGGAEHFPRSGPAVLVAPHRSWLDPACVAGACPRPVRFLMMEKIYRRPFASPGEDRRPTLTWPRQIPIEGEPADVVEIVKSYAEWLPKSDVPKLFVNAEPGAILIGEQREFCRSWANQREVTVKGSHFIQEDSPDEIGRAVAGWLRGL